MRCPCEKELAQVYVNIWYRPQSAFKIHPHENNSSNGAKLMSYQGPHVTNKMKTQRGEKSEYSYGGGRKSSKVLDNVDKENGLQACSKAEDILIAGSCLNTPFQGQSYVSSFSYLNQNICFAS